jgi:hypothetical protein
MTFRYLIVDEGNGQRSIIIRATLRLCWSQMSLPVRALHDTQTRHARLCGRLARVLMGAGLFAGVI